MGKSTMMKFIDNGYIVFGLDIEESDYIHPNFHFYKTDLTDINQINKVYDSVKELDIKLDAIISTAGIYNLDSLIEINEEDFIKLFNINVFSIYRINKTFISLLKEKGKIFVISSELGPLDPLPFTGLYAISKSTIEKYVYSLRMEVQLLGYKVILIRPGAVKTSLLDISTSSLDNFINKTTHYKCNADRFKNIVNSVENKNISSDKIGELIFKVNKKKNPKYVYNINRNKLLLLLNILPKKLQNKIIYKILKDK
jgi:short-subunit dehydrogenase